MDKWTRIKHEVVMRFWAVQIVARLQVLVGTIILIGAIFMFLIAAGVLSNQQVGYGATTLSALIAVGLFVVGISIVAQGQLLEVFLQIEENTRPRLEEN